MRYFKILLLVITFINVSCIEDDIAPPLCLTGDCEGDVFLNYPKDSNGYYHVDLDFNSTYLPRFDIFIEADSIDPYYYYNDIGVIQAAFESQSYWTMSNGVRVDIVQTTTMYLNNSTHNNEYITSVPNRKWGKRIVGPIPNEFVGDTLTIYAEIYWDGGSKSKSQLYVEKIIIE